MDSDKNEITQLDEHSERVAGPVDQIVIRESCCNDTSPDLKPPDAVLLVATCVQNRL